MGGGGKSLFGEQAFEGLLDGPLVAFDREQIVASLLVEDLPGGFILRVERVGQHDLADQIQVAQQPAPRRDFVARSLGHDTAQKAPRGVDRIDDLHPAVTDLFTVHDHDPILGRPQDLMLPAQEHPLDRVDQAGPRRLVLR